MPEISVTSRRTILVDRELEVGFGTPRRVGIDIAARTANLEGVF